MKSFKSIPYILLYISLFFSVLIAAIYNLSFLVFVKRTTPILIILFSASYVFISTFEKHRKKTVENQSTIDLITPNEPISIEYVDDIDIRGVAEADEDDEFTPLNFDELRDEE